MPTPTGYTMSYSAYASSNSQLNSLLYGTSWSWSSGFTVTNLTYSFFEEGTSKYALSYSASQEYLDAYELAPAQQTAIIDSLAKWSAVSNVKFTQVTDTDTTVGDLRFGGYAGMDDNTAAWAYLPDNTPVAGDVWIGPQTNEPAPAEGSYDYMTFMHEIGHALGLKHPFEQSFYNSTTLSPMLDDVRYTIMSYTNGYSYEPTTPMLLDILAIQKLYGANALWEAGNTTYSWGADQSVFETIWDGGGVDTIDASNQASSVFLNLNEGEFSNIGKTFYDYQQQKYINDGLAIAFGAKIENATGSAFKDTLVGNDLANVLDGGAGADFMLGGAGNDTYIVDNVADLVIETSVRPSEIDTIIASVSYTLGANLENLTLTGTANLRGTGNTRDNLLIGNDGDNNLNGGAGSDELRAGAGNDVLDGGAGIDKLIGGTGDDTYIVDNVSDTITELDGEGYDVVKASISYTLAAFVEEGRLQGTEALNLTGNSQANTLIGNNGANVLDGKAGADTMSGGLGNDTYIVDNVDDVVVETSALLSEIDTVQASVTYALSANLEVLTLTGLDAINGTGNGLNNRINGNAGNNILDGGAGSDTLTGGLGNDTYVVDNILDVIIETSNLTTEIDTVRASINWTLGANLENLTLTGSANLSGTGNALKNLLIGNAGNNVLSGGLGNDELQGGAGDDRLDGGAGLDVLIGGIGNDTYIVDNVADLITELDGEGLDLVQASVSYTLSDFVEDGQALGTAAINLTGNDEANTLTGNNAANILDGKAGADTLIGGLGNDTYIVDNVGDVVVETSALLNEIDTVQASISYTLGANVENLTLTGSDSLDGTGNALNNRITGNSGNNRLDGGIGIDTLVGGLGNDTYVVDNLRDVVLETSTLPGEIDTVESSINWTLGANLENLTLTGSANLNGIGNALANTLTGNDGANSLSGAAGDDILRGGAGNDRLDGGLGIDTLVGGTGDDFYIVDNSGDTITELDNEGYDVVQTSVSYTLGNFVEEGRLLGNAALRLTGNDQDNLLLGNALANTLEGGAGDDTLNGGAGIDTLIGGTGNDTYVVDNLGDKITELDGEGHDTVQTTVSYTLSDFVEDGVLLGAATINLTGSNQDNTLTGNNAANILDGKAGADTLIGGLGNDTYIVDNIGDVVVETSALLNEIDTVQASISYTLGANVENLTLTGSDSLDATGNALNNRITGNSGDNRLDGGLGIDTLTGGLGNDTYVVDNLKDVVVETSTLVTEIDTVESSVNWALGANLENLTLTGSDNLNGTGNALANVLIGNAGNNVLNGGAGIDTLKGGDGNDTFVLDQFAELALLEELSNQGSDTLNIGFAATAINNTVDLSNTNLRNVENVTLLGAGLFSVIGNDQNNILVGNAFANTLNGGAGDDTLNGGAGIDTLIGGTGNDTYLVDNLSDKITELDGEGHDTVQTTVTYTLSNFVEDGQALGAAAINLTGNDEANTLTGNNAANILDGKAGADTLIGGQGNDTYIVDNIGDAVVETSALLTEIDTVQSSISYTLGANVENLTLTGSDSLDGTGNALNNRITGNSGSNRLDGGLGIDTLTGGLGNDTYVVDNLKDVVVETSTLVTEIDTVESSVNWALGANLENLTLTGSDNLNGTGNALANVLIGNAGNNVLNGGAGIDTLKGGDGNDTFVLDQFAELALLEELSNQGSDTLNISFAATAINNTVDLSNTNLRNVENVTLLGAGLFSVIGNDQNNILVGNASANTLNGGAGDDTLNGGAGIDTLIGGTGNDTYLVDNIGDKIAELDGEGRDTVQTTVSYTLSNFVEDGQALGAAAINLTGNDEANTLTGNNAANVLDGKAGADTLIGGLGNDTYIVDNIGDVVVETSALLTEIDTVQTSISYTLGANVENLTLTGSDSLDGTGNALNNRITGNSGSNRLDGGLGIDTLTGGLGNDTYVVDNLKDVIVETSTLPTEIDTVESSVNWALGANLENLTLTGSDNLNGTGNAQANVLIGNAGNNVLNGGAGIDTLKGGDGNDTFVLDQFAELALLEELSNQGTDTLNISFAATAINNTVDLSSANLRNVENVTLLGAGLFGVIGNDQNNILVGNAFANTLNGGAGDDTLNGGAGIDTLIGGTGNDTYLVDNIGDKITELDGEGRDTVQTTVTYTLSNFVEDGQALGAAAINLTGNDEANTLTGNNAANVLDGKAGADTLIGGLGNDTYIVDNIGDVVVENSALAAEIDTVQASISYTLGANVENLTLTGSEGLDGTGNALNNRITGNSGSNRLDGGAGIDTLTGGLGNDTYVVDNLKDVVVETSTLVTEIDTVESSVNWALGANLENLTLTGGDNLNGTGNALTNTIIGNSGNNILNGGAGNDLLDGGDGNDHLIGGLGTDTLTGGSGADTFVFNLLSELGLGDKRDAITDFNSAEGDKIDLSKLDANVLLGGINPFTFIGAAEFTGAGQLRFVDEVLSGNINGNLNNDFEIHLVGVTALTANDFV